MKTFRRLLVLTAVASIACLSSHAQTTPLSPEEAYALGLASPQQPVNPEIDLTNVQTGNPFIDLPNDTMGPYALETGQHAVSTVLEETKYEAMFGLGLGGIALDGALEGTVGLLDSAGVPGADYVSAALDGINLLGELAEATSMKGAMEIWGDFFGEQAIDYAFEKLTEALLDAMAEFVNPPEQEKSDEPSDEALDQC
jgi:hypothetical protein